VLKDRDSSLFFKVSDPVPDPVSQILIEKHLNIAKVMRKN
jgi:hypothetical protein